MVEENRAREMSRQVLKTMWDELVHLLLNQNRRLDSKLTGNLLSFNASMIMMEND